jgi:hypothetical protein
MNGMITVFELNSKHLVAIRFELHRVDRTETQAADCWVWYHPILFAFHPLSLALTTVSETMTELSK